MAIEPVSPVKVTQVVNGRVRVQKPFPLLRRPGMAGAVACGSRGLMLHVEVVD